jgi:hypothetical protein
MTLVRRVIRRLLRHIGELTHDDGELVTMYDALGYVPNLITPRSFNEKIVKRKLSPYPSMWIKLCDKVEVRQYVRDAVGSHLLNDVYLISDDPREVSLTKLPDRFVVKANHGSGWNLLVSDKSQTTDERLQRICQEWLAACYPGRHHERWYNGVRPKILVERFLCDATGAPPVDYKLWVFHGHVRFIQVDIDRFRNHTRTLFDRQWVRQLWGVGYPLGGDVPAPTALEEMIAVAERLAGGIDFVRVDLYCLEEGRIVFGEMTFAPGSGWEPFLPSEKYDFQVGTFW